MAETSYGGQIYEEDVIATAAGDLTITFIGHATLMLRWQNRVIHVDPVSAEADYEAFPTADLILLTHHHFDHLDPNAVEAVRGPGTEIVLTGLCAERVAGGNVVADGETVTLHGIPVLAIAAYNQEHNRPDGKPYHPRGEGNGYMVSFADRRVYIAGDTEDTPEMMRLERVDVAFLPMNVPYTMTPEMVARAVRAFQPRILYPYHYGDTDTDRLLSLLSGFDLTEVRIRRMA